ncbi:hypothetical protein BC937DRAFT_87975 [Endogone sp. FLAS-F59071]|nr:hypothetical protein BC937DRAFT_87975 [Endogone sp. FLAS-F59071]|eukprot:RUS19120.1 hypothetical protein BC937DRAFT_87975 [Endogone sp. FLAS-F59071]
MTNKHCSLFTHTHRSPKVNSGSTFTEQRQTHRNSRHQDPRPTILRFPMLTNLPRKNHSKVTPEHESLVPTLALALERHFYSPGDNVRGQLCLDVNSFIGVERLCVAIVGTVQTPEDTTSATSFADGFIEDKSRTKVLDVRIRLIRDWRRVFNNGKQYDGDAWVRINDRDRAFETVAHGPAPIIPPRSSSLNMTTKTPEDQSFLLEPNQHVVPFELAIPLTTKIPGTFDHHISAVSYSIVAMLIYRSNPSSRPLPARASQKITLAPLIPTKTQIYNTPLITSPKKSSVTALAPKGSDTPSRKACPFVSFTGLRNAAGPKPLTTGYLEHSTFIPYRAFVPGEPIPLKIRLVNRSDLSVISRVSVEARLIRHVSVTSGAKTTVENREYAGVVALFDGEIDSEPAFSKFEEKSVSSRERITFGNGEMYLDMKNILQVPDDCPYTVFSDTTHGIIEVRYEVMVMVKIIEAADKNVVGDRNPKQGNRTIALKNIVFPVVIGSVRQENETVRRFEKAAIKRSAPSVQRKEQRRKFGRGRKRSRPSGSSDNEETNESDTSPLYQTYAHIYQDKFN